MSTHGSVPASRRERLSSAAVTAAAALFAAVPAALVVGGILMLTSVRPAGNGIDGIQTLVDAAPAWVSPVSLTATVVISWLIVSRLGRRTIGDTVMYLTTVRAADASAEQTGGAGATRVGAPRAAGRVANLVRTGVPAALLLAGSLAHQVPLALVAVALLWAPALGRDGRSVFDRAAGVRVLSSNVRRDPVDPAVAEKWARIQRTG